MNLVDQQILEAALADPHGLDCLQDQVLPRLQPFLAGALDPPLTFYSDGQDYLRRRQRQPLQFPVRETPAGLRLNCSQLEVRASVNSLSQAIQRSWTDFVDDAAAGVYRHYCPGPEPRHSRAAAPSFLQEAVAQRLLEQKMTKDFGATVAACVAEDPKTGQLRFNPKPLAESLLKDLIAGREQIYELLSLGGVTPSLGYLQQPPPELQLCAELAEKDFPAAAWWLRHRHGQNPREAAIAPPQSVAQVQEWARLQFLTSLHETAQQTYGANGAAVNDYLTPQTPAGRIWDYYRRLPRELAAAPAAPEDYRRLYYAYGGRQPKSLILANRVLRDPLPTAVEPNLISERHYDERNYRYDAQRSRAKAYLTAPGFAPWIRWLDRQLAALPEKGRAKAERRLLEPWTAYAQAGPPPTDKEFPTIRWTEAQAQEIFHQGHPPARTDQKLRELFQCGEPGKTKDRLRKDSLAAAQPQVESLLTAAHARLRAVEKQDALAHLLPSDLQPLRAASLADPAARETPGLLGLPAAEPGRPHSTGMKLIQDPEGRLQAATLYLHQKAGRHQPGSHHIPFRPALASPTYDPKETDPLHNSRPRYPQRCHGLEDLLLDLLHDHLQREPRELKLWPPRLRTLGLNLALTGNRQITRSRLPGLAESLNHRLTAAVRAAADPDICEYLKTAEVQTESLHLALHNHFKVNKRIYQELLRRNPGAVAWNLLRQALQDRQNEPNGETTRYNHPGQVIAEVKAAFHAAGGRHWRAFAQQPPALIGMTLGSAAAYSPEQDRARLKQAIQHSDLLYQAGLQPQRSPGHLAIFREGLEFLNSPRMNPQRRARCAQAAELFYKKAAGLEAGQTEALELLRHQAASVRDYINALPGKEPLAARRWDGLRKRSEEWHQELREIRYASAVEQALKRQNGQLRRWNSLVGEWVDPKTGYHCQPLDDQEKVFNEAEAMEHCVGRDYYLNRCWGGSLRLFHLHHPTRLPEGATVELRLSENIAGRVTVGQISRRRNQPPPPEASAAAGNLKARYAQALRQPQAKHVGEYYEPAPAGAAAAPEKPA